MKQNFGDKKTNSQLAIRLENSRKLNLKPTVEKASLIFIKMSKNWASLVAQWLRICLPMQGTRVQALVWEDPTCRGATRPMSHNY